MTYIEQFYILSKSDTYPTITNLDDVIGYWYKISKKHPNRAKKAHSKVKKLEKRCKITDPYTGDPIKLLLWQKAFYEIHILKELLNE